MKLSQFCIVATLGLISVARVSEATTLGLAREGKYAIWDTFAPGNSSYSYLAPDEASSGLNTSLFVQTTPDGDDFGGQGDFFNHASGQASWYIPVSTPPFEITKLTLQIKMNTESTSFFWPILQANAQMISPTWTTVAGTGETIGGNPVSIITWTWDYLALPAYASFAFDFTNLASQNVSLDAIAINVYTPVPEPGAWASMAAGLGLLLGCRRFLRRPSNFPEMVK